MIIIVKKTVKEYECKCCKSCDGQFMRGEEFFSLSIGGEDLLEKGTLASGYTEMELCKSCLVALKTNINNAL